MNQSFAQALVFFLAVFFVLSIVFSMQAHYKQSKKHKKLSYLFMVLFAGLSVVCLLSWFAST